MHIDAAERTTRRPTLHPPRPSPLHHRCQAACARRCQGRPLRRRGAARPAARPAGAAGRPRPRRRRGRCSQGRPPREGGPGHEGDTAAVGHGKIALPGRPLLPACGGCEAVAHRVGQQQAQERTSLARARQLAGCAASPSSSSASCSPAPSAPPLLGESKGVATAAAAAAPGSAAAGVAGLPWPQCSSQASNRAAASAWGKGAEGGPWTS